MDFQAIHDRLLAANAPGLLGADEPRLPDKATKDKGRSGRPFVMVEAAQLVENAAALIDVIIRAKPAVAKGTYLKKISISSTMGPGVRVDPSSAGEAKAA